jgi:xanthine dehydrogenase YagR molybdenum-binding subunit
MGGERFGWAQRSPEPRSMREGNDLIGYGMASAYFPAHRMPSSASATLFANGSVVIKSAASDMGPGTYTSMTQVAAETLGLPVERIRFELGDTDMPRAPVHGGSMTMASVGSAVKAACQALRTEIFTIARRQDGPFPELDADMLELRDGVLLSRAGGTEAVAIEDLLRRFERDSVEAHDDWKPDSGKQQYASASFGAVFVEVRVDSDLGTVRVPRMIGAYDAGRIVNPKIARSQCIGGMVGGLGMALLEMAEWDERYGRVMNANLAEYLVPVCADIVELDALFVPSDDPHFNPLGVKGLAEIAICGVAPAIANAVYHATGARVRDLPITPEKLLQCGL